MDITTETGQPRQNTRDRRSGQGNHDRTAMAGEPEHGSQNRTARTEQDGQTVTARIVRGQGSWRQELFAITVEGGPRK